MATGTITCSKCGEDSPANSIYCIACGASLANGPMTAPIESPTRDTIGAIGSTYEAITGTHSDGYEASFALAGLLASAHPERVRCINEYEYLYMRSLEQSLNAMKGLSSTEYILRNLQRPTTSTLPQFVDSKPVTLGLSYENNLLAGIFFVTAFRKAFPGKLPASMILLQESSAINEFLSLKWGPKGTPTHIVLKAMAELEALDFSTPLQSFESANRFLKAFHANQIQNMLSDPSKVLVMEEDIGLGRLMVLWIKRMEKFETALRQPRLIVRVSTTDCIVYGNIADANENRVFRKKQQKQVEKLSNTELKSQKDQKKIATELLASIKSYLDPASALTSEEVIKKFKSAGKEGVDVLYRCLNDVFATRAEMWSLLYVAREVARDTMDIRLISTFEKILVECSDLVEGHPTPPAWMPTLRPVIIGGGKYGWDDGTWLRVAHSLAEFLLANVPQLPADLSAEHTDKLAQAINHYIEKLENLRGQATLKEALEKEVNYWKSLKAQLPK